MAIVLVLAIAAGAFKIVSGVVYGSNALFVDAMTSFANIFALITIVKFKRLSALPPDSDHHFGHERMEYGGLAITLLTYSFVAGIAVTKLFYSLEYEVRIGAFYTSLIATALYAVLILIVRRGSPVLRAYGAFTASELLEGVIGIFSTLGGSLYSYLIDYCGALILTGYIFVEIYEASKSVLGLLVDIAPPPEVYDNIISSIESRGFRVRRLRVRTIYPGKLHGDAIVQGDGDIEKLKKELKAMGMDLCVERASH